MVKKEVLKFYRQRIPTYAVGKNRIINCALFVSIVGPHVGYDTILYQAMQKNCIINIHYWLAASAVVHDNIHFWPKRPANAYKKLHSFAPLAKTV